MSEISYFNPTQRPLNLIMKVKEPVAEHAQKLRAMLKMTTPDGLNAVGTVHFGRFFFLENDTRFCVITSYDGTLRSYIQDFVNEVSATFNALLSCVEVPEGVVPVQRNAERFYQFVEEHNAATDLFYCAYPKMSVLQILEDAKSGGV